MSAEDHFHRMVAFRRPTMDDLPSIQLCQERNLPERYDAATWEMLVDAHRATSWIMVQWGNGPVHGFVLASRDHILVLGVDEAYRNHGKGSRLLEMVLQDRAVKYPVYLHVRVSNRTARRLYQRLGFRNDHVLPEYYASTSQPEDAMLMRCDTRPDEDAEEGDTVREVASPPNV